MPRDPDHLSRTAFLRVKNDVKANKLLFRLHEALGCPIDVSELDRYDGTFYRCVFATALPIDDECDSLVERVLRLAVKLAPVWRVGGISADGSGHFWGG